MAKKLSIIEGQTTPQVGWNGYGGNPYNDEAISKVKDNVGDLEIPVTSIPSPFAQMHLFETAFDAINELHTAQGKMALTGNSTYHKLVSNCLDVYELLFSYDLLQLKGRLDIRTWRINELENMLDQSSPGMTVFAETLLLFIRNYNADAKFTSQGITSAFDQLTLIYFEDKIIAGTSPYTGFFTIREGLPESIKNLDNRIFFVDSLALYERTEAFQLFINAFFTAHPALVTCFDAVHTYIKNNQESVKGELGRDLTKMSNQADVDDLLKEYDQLDIQNNPIYIFEKKPFYYKKVAAIEIETEVKRSDYAIVSSKNLEQPPLALATGLRNRHWTYIRSALPEDLIVPDSPIAPVVERKLPGTDIDYPFVVRNDFLSKHLVRLSYAINVEKFWLPDDCNVDNILIPILPAYFDFFTLDDLKKNLSIEALPSGAINVELKIPVKGSKGRGHITFSRTYIKANPKNVENEKQGSIQESTLGLGIYPFFRVSEVKYNDRYKVMMLHRPDEDVDCHFLRENPDKAETHSISSEFIVRTRKEESSIYESKYIEVSNVFINDNQEINLELERDLRFDVLHIKCYMKDCDINASLIPLFKDTINLNTKKATLGFDIGTSNSFVSFGVGGRNVERLSTFKEFNVQQGLQLVMLHAPASDVDKSSQFDFNDDVGAAYVPAQLNEFIPSMIGEGSDYNLPFRTIINQDNDSVSGKLGSLSILSNINIPFGFGREVPREELDEIYSNLKWGITDPSNKEARNRLFCFIEQLVWMGRNKLLSEGINPEFAEVIWFKPLSMSDQQRTIFNVIWKDLFAMYFSKKVGKTGNLISVTESWAPFYSYSTGVPKGKVFLNLDIGGGTSDLLVFEDDAPLITTSFRFAGDSLFDDGLSTSNQRDNGFVLKYARIMEEEVLAGDYARKANQEYILGSKDLRSVDLISFYFTIKEFRDRLKLDGDFQLLFLIHASALFYHVSQILKIKGVKDLPSLVGFSGNGSKLLEITNRDSDLNRNGGIINLFKAILESFYVEEEVPKIRSISLENPKEATAFGGVLGIDRIKSNPTADLDTYYMALGDRDTLLLKNDSKTRKNYQYRKFLNEDDGTINDVTDNILDFFNLFFDDLWYDCQFLEQFGLSKSYNPEKLKEFFCDKKGINDAVRDAINQKVNIEEEPVITETLFFYPIKSMIYAFSKTIASTEVNNFKGHE